MTRVTAPLILLVDDVEDNRSMYAMYLAAFGYRVAQAPDGSEAVARARELLPDVVVMDLALPVMDGLSATRELKGDERTRGIPIIALTGCVTPGYMRAAREAGCDRFLAKPCLPGALRATIHHVLAQRA